MVTACLSEEVPLKGFVGDWSSVEPVHAHFLTIQPAYRPSYDTRNILYSLSLIDHPLLAHQPQVRYLAAADFPDIHRLRHLDDPTDCLPTGLDDQQERQLILEQTAEHLWWGVEVDGHVQAMVLMSAQSSRIGQLGAVYTAMVHRRRGLGRRMMLHMLKDCRDVMGHAKSVLFTDDDNFAAQGLYESIGYQRIGYFALILS